MTVPLENLGAEVTDPILQSRAGHAQYQAPIYDALLGFNYEAQFGGLGRGVAEEWEIDPDGLSWTFKIQDGLTFHDGEPLTADDVKFSLERTMFHPETVTSDARRWPSKCDSLRKKRLKWSIHSLSGFSPRVPSPISGACSHGLSSRAGR